MQPFRRLEARKNADQDKSFIFFNKWKTHEGVLKMNKTKIKRLSARILNLKTSVDELIDDLRDEGDDEAADELENVSAYLEQAADVVDYIE